MENEDSENIGKDVIYGSQYEKDDDSAVYFISIAVTLFLPGL